MKIKDIPNEDYKLEAIDKALSKHRNLELTAVMEMELVDAFEWDDVAKWTFVELGYSTKYHYLLCDVLDLSLVEVVLEIATSMGADANIVYFTPLVEVWRNLHNVVPINLWSSIKSADKRVKVMQLEPKMIESIMLQFGNSEHFKTEEGVNQNLALDYAFDWEESIEGEDYWNQVSMNYRINQLTEFKIVEHDSIIEL